MFEGIVVAAAYCMEAQGRMFLASEPEVAACKTALVSHG